MQTNRYDSTGFAPTNIPSKSVTMPSKSETLYTNISDHIKTIETLAEECRRRGNRLEIMNGKVYEVKRTLLMELDKV